MVWQRFGPGPSDAEKEARRAAFLIWLAKSGEGQRLKELRARVLAHLGVKAVDDAGG